MTPNPVQTAVINGPAAYEANGGIIAITVAANSTFIHGRVLEVEECNNNPTSEADCDGLTLTNVDSVSHQAVKPAADGSVASYRFEFYELPTNGGFDDLSTVSAGPTTPAAIWIGDDPSNWNANSFVASGITALDPAPPASTPETPLAIALPIGAVVLLGGGFLLLRRRRPSDTRS